MKAQVMVRILRAKAPPWALLLLGGGMFFFGACRLQADQRVMGWFDTAIGVSALLLAVPRFLRSDISPWLLIILGIGMGYFGVRRLLADERVTGWFNMAIAAYALLVAALLFSRPASASTRTTGTDG